MSVPWVVAFGQLENHMLEAIQTALYQIELFADQLVSGQLNHLGPIGVAVIFMAGLLTSLTPCTLSMLPLTIGYMGGYDAENRLASARQSMWFALGFGNNVSDVGECGGDRWTSIWPSGLRVTDCGEPDCHFDGV